MKGLTKSGEVRPSVSLSKSGLAVGLKLRELGLWAYEMPLCVAQLNALARLFARKLLDNAKEPMMVTLVLGLRLLDIVLVALLASLTTSLAGGPNKSL